MPTKGYKQSPEHIKNKADAKVKRRVQAKKPKTKLRKKGKPIEETPPAVYRDYKCTH
jgi:hypothetical protein